MACFAAIAGITGSIFASYALGAEHERPGPLAFGNKNAIGFRLAHQEAARERNFPANTIEGAASTSSRRCLIY